MLPFRTIKELKNLKGKRVLLRLDLNEPVINGVVGNDFRIRRSMPTIEFLKKRGARIIIIAHADEKTPSLKPIARHMNRFVRVGFVPKVTGPMVRDSVGRLPEGGILMLENLRSSPGEEKNSSAFAGELASLGDIYINEAFSASHRVHASIMRLPRMLPSYAGILFALEYENLTRARKPKRPFFFILGGEKFETKLPLVKRFLFLAESIFIGGGPANSFFKLKGYETGKSVVGKSIPGLKSLLKNKKIILPLDARLLSGEITLPDGLSRSDKIVDIGPETLLRVKSHIAGAKAILFNGPVGIYDEGFSWGTEEILKLLARASAKTIVGGGDTLAVVTKLKLENKFTFTSTGGGAMLEFLARGTLPGIEALKRR